MAPTVFDKLSTNISTLLARQPRPDLAPSPDSLVARQQSSDFAVAWTQTFRRKESDVLANGHLSDLGRQAAIRKVAAEAAGDLGPLRRPITATKEAMGRLKSVVLDYMSLPEGQDKLEALLLAQEVRTEYRSRPQSEKDGAFIQAAERLDRATLRAFQTAPAGPWVSGEMLQRAEQVYAEHNNPDVLEQLRRLQQLFDHYVSLSRMIALALLAYDLVPDQVEQALGVSLQEMQIDRPTPAPKGANRG